MIFSNLYYSISKFSITVIHFWWKMLKKYCSVLICVVCTWVHAYMYARMCVCTLIEQLAPIPSCTPFTLSTPVEEKKGFSSYFPTYLPFFVHVCGTQMEFGVLRLGVWGDRERERKVERGEDSRELKSWPLELRAAQMEHGKLWLRVINREVDTNSRTT